LVLVHGLNYKIIKLHFGSLILLPSSGRKGGKGQKTYMLGPLVELAYMLGPLVELAYMLGPLVELAYMLGPLVELASDLDKQTVIFRVLASCSMLAEDGGGMCLRNANI
jgi:hypothetical protein